MRWELQIAVHIPSQPHVKNKANLGQNLFMQRELATFSQGQMGADQ